MDGCANLEAIEVDTPNRCSLLVVYCGEVVVSSLNARCQSKVSFERGHVIGFDLRDMELECRTFPFEP